MATMQDVGTSHVQTTEKVVAGSSVLELIAGAAAVVLPILALVGVYPMFLAAISFIAIGGGMMSQGGGLSVHARAAFPTTRTSNPEGAGLIGGMTVEILGGAAVIALGILALLRVVPVTLLGAASIVGGGALVLGAGNTSRLSSFRYGAATELDESQRNMLRESVRAAAGADVLAGLAGIVLGILVLAGVGTPRIEVTLSVIAALSLGGALFLNGTTVGARMAALLES